MKKVIMLILMLFILGFNITLVKAENYTCVYKVNYKGWCDVKEEETAKMIVDTDKKKITYKHNNYYNFTNLDKYIDQTQTEESIVELYDGKCPDVVYICQNNGSNQNLGIIFNPELYTKLSSGTKIAIGGGKEFKINTMNDCRGAEYQEEGSTKPAMENQFSCKSYDSYISDMRELYCTPNTKNCDNNSLKKYYEKKEQLASMCSLHIKYSDYSNQCLIKCMNYSEDINEIEKNIGNQNSCGFSDKLFTWAANILKWIKYILPVIVIIFGILDFIKAMASESDDEMKKSQKRFIIRLVSAALVFLVPLLIQFILEKMGYTVNTCDLW